MLTRAQVQRYSNESGLRDIMIAEKEVVLTFLLQLLSERGILDRLAFKGGTCLRKMFVGNQGRFSTDLDFTGIEEHDHEDIILDMMAAFEQVYHGIQFAIPTRKLARQPEPVHFRRLCRIGFHPSIAAVQQATQCPRMHQSR
jgi:predicted nucleotidyltransferase component of viral defense system